ncbi:MAG TPA: Uma2 family endonuclease [Dehalococcoidia bacterium]|nr:Uma2 family endonuclease [Dehalococcoidia bacterium]
MTSEKRLVTIEDLERMPNQDCNYELLDGELIELAPSNLWHDGIRFNASFILGLHVRATGAGRVFSGDTGIVLHRGPDRLRAPDVGFIAADRLPAGRIPERFTEIVPDLVVEIVSPSDTAAYVLQKSEEWLAAGVRLVLLLDPGTQTVTAATSPAERRIFHAGETFSCEPVLPGLSIAVDELFA